MAGICCGLWNFPTNSQIFTGGKQNQLYTSVTHLPHELSSCLTGVGNLQKSASNCHKRYVLPLYVSEIWLGQISSIPLKSWFSPNVANFDRAYLKDYKSQPSVIEAFATLYLCQRSVVRVLFTSLCLGDMSWFYLFQSCLYLVKIRISVVWFDQVVSLIQKELEQFR